MNGTNLFKIALRALSNNKLRAFLTMLGIIIGLAAVITQITYAKGQSREIMEYYASMGTNQINVYAYKWGAGSDRVFQSLYDYCLQLGDLVEGVTPSGTTWGTIKYQTKNSDSMNYQPQVYLGSDQWSLCNNFSIGSGRDLSYLDVKSYRQVCVLGSRAKELFFDYSDPIGKTLTISGVPFEVIGVYAQKDFSDQAEEGWSMDNVIVIPYTANRALAAVSGSYTDMSEFVVKARSREAVTEAITRLDGFLKGLIGDQQSGNSFGSYSVYSAEQGREQMEEATKKQQNMLGGIAAISLLVGGIGIMNIMLVTVTERTREIGIKKSIGAPRSEIISQFLVESAILSGMGGLIGIALGFALSLILGKAMYDLILLPNALVTLGSFTFSVVIGILFGIYPAVKASNLQPVDALRAD